MVLFVAVLIASLGALQYTKSAVLNTEKRRLVETAKELARNYTDKAKTASQARGLSSVDLKPYFSEQAASQISQGALQKVDGIGGGFYRSDGQQLLGYTPPARRENEELLSLAATRNDMQAAILDTARNAANMHVTADRVLTGDNDIFLIEAAPIGGRKSNWGSAWTVERLQSIPGRQPPSGVPDYRRIGDCGAGLRDFDAFGRSESASRSQKDREQSAKSGVGPGLADPDGFGSRRNRAHRASDQSIGSDAAGKYRPGKTD